MWLTVHCYWVSAVSFCRDIMFNSCEFGQLSNFLTPCIPPPKSWVSPKTQFKGVLCFLVFHSGRDIQHPVARYTSMDAWHAIGFSDILAGLLGLLTATEKQLMGTLI